MGPVLQPFNVHNLVGRKRTHTLVAKSRVCSSRCCGLSSVVYHGWEGKRAHLIWSLALLCDPQHSLFLCYGESD